MGWISTRPFYPGRVPKSQRDKTYIIKEWFQILEYRMNFHKTFGLFPYLGKNIANFLNSISFFHKVIRNNFGGIYIFTYKKNVIPLTPQKVIFNKDYKVTHLAKHNL